MPGLQSGNGSCDHGLSQLQRLQQPNGNLHLKYLMELLLAYAMSFVGTPYRWGGRHPSEGFDCSGLVRTILVAQGLDVGMNSTAQTLYEQFSREGRLLESVPDEPGALAFYGSRNTDIVHVAMTLNREQQIEAYPGDHTVTTLEAAIARHAFVRVSPIRKENRFALLMPDYPFKNAP